MVFLMMALLGWFKTRAGISNLTIYIVIGVAVTLFYLDWKHKVEENVILEQANTALTTQINELAIKIEVERRVNQRLEGYQSKIKTERDIAQKELEEARDETGHINRDAVAELLCKRGLATREACQRTVTVEPD